MDGARESVRGPADRCLRPDPRLPATGGRGSSVWTAINWRRRRASRTNTELTFPQVMLVTSVDVTVGAEDEFNRWYNEKHLPEVLACPCFLSAARMKPPWASRGSSRSTNSTMGNALTTPEMQRVRGWGEMFPHVRNFHERIYRRVYEYGT